jgi:hypothetical protein
MPTNACGGGDGQASVPGTTVVALGAGRIAQILEALELPELIVALPFVEVGELVLNNFCNSDLPTMTALTLPEAQALVTLQPSTDFESGLAKLRDYVLNGAWPLFCNCVSGSSVIPPAPPTPTGTPITQNPAAGTNAPCITACVGNNASGLQPCQWQGGVSNPLPQIMGLNATPGSNPTAAQATFHLVSGGAPTPSATVTFRYVGPGLTEIDHVFNFASGWTDISQVDAWPSGGYQGMDLQLNTGATGNAFVAEIHESFFCNGTNPTGLQQPCCPPDTATQATLDAILNMVTLIQRQQVPFAYNLGATHSQVGGSGTLSVQGLLGVKVVPNMIPPFAGIELGDPDELWLQSWITWGNADGWTNREFLRHSPHVSLPQYAGQFTTLGYTFAPGLTCDIVELTREP